MSGQPLRAIAYLQWRLAANHFRSAKGRGELEGLSRISEVVVPVILGIIFIPIALGGMAAGGLAGWALAQQSGGVDVASIIGFVLLLPTLWVLIHPFSLVTQGRVERGELLRLLPIPRSLLRNLELLRALVDPVFLVFAPGLLMVAVGALLGGRPLLAVVAFAAGIIFLLLLACLASLLALAAQLLLRDRRRGEVVALIFFLVLSIAGFLPQLLVPRHEPARARATMPVRRSEAPRTDTRPDAFELPRGMRWLPPFQYAQVVSATATGQSGLATGACASLAGLMLVAYVASIPLHRRLLDTPGSSQSQRAMKVEASTVEIPVVSRPVGAVALVQIRTIVRTVRGKMAVVFSPFVGILAAFMFTRGGPDTPFFFASAYFAPVFVAFVGLANLAVFTCNQFATSGTGLMLEFLEPLDDRTLLRGRALATTLLCAGSLAASLVLLALVMPSASLATTIAVFFGALAVHVSMTPVTAMLSALFPKNADLSRIGRAGQPHALATLINLFGQGVAALPPAGCIVLAVLVLKQSWLAPVLTSAWLLLAGAVSLALFAAAERVVAARRENLALVAAGR